nr:MAG TPA: Protein of unknown function (DUF806) [Caudoviricetes sp.]
MSLLSELKDIAENCGVKVETGMFSDTPPDEYIVLTPLADSFEMHCDNLPEYEIQEVRISIFSKGNYTALKYMLVTALLKADITITDRRYIGHEDDTGYHHYAVDTAKSYEMEEF